MLFGTAHLALFCLFVIGPNCGTLLVREDFEQPDGRIDVGRVLDMREFGAARHRDATAAIQAASTTRSPTRAEVQISSNRHPFADGRRSRCATARTIDVAAFGANGGDVTAAIQRAIDGAAPGDTIHFPRGIYRVSTITLRSGLTYNGDPGAVLQGAPLPMVTVDGRDSHDIIVDGLTFRGPGDDPNSNGLLNLSGDGSASSVNHITISNSTFEGGGIAFDFLKNSQIINNRFPSFAGSAIRGYHPDNSSLSSNTFTDVAQGIDLVFDANVPNWGRNVTIDHNVGTGFTRMGIETIGNDPPQAGASQNLHVECNRFTDWHNVPGETNTIAYSIVTLGPGTQVLNNYAQGPTNNPNPGWNGFGIELGGPDALAQGNYIDGFSTGIVGYVSGDIIQNNNIINSVGRPIHTHGRTDEIVRSNTSDPTAPLPSCVPRP